MRRGLMAWDPRELPQGVLHDRLARLRGAMQQDKLDAFLIYTSLVRPSAVCWLTGFTPYWSEGALLVLGDGAPIFCTALSKRVAEWIRTTNPVSDIVNAPQPGKLLGERLAADRTIKRVGVLELDALPAGLYDDVVAAAPSVEMVDASQAFAAIRRRIDDAERRLLMRADAIAAAALGQIEPTRADDAGAVAGLVEQHARLSGAEEAYIAVAADLAADARLLRVTKSTPLGERFAVRASIAYKGAWVRCTKTFARNEADRRAVARAEVWLDDIRTTLDPSKPFAIEIAARVNAFDGARLQDWMMESCVGSYPLQVVAAARGPGRQAAEPPSFAVVTVALTIDDKPWLGAAPVIPAAPVL